MEFDNQRMKRERENFYRKVRRDTGILVQNFTTSNDGKRQRVFLPQGPLVFEQGPC